MKLGLFAINMYACADPEAIAQTARRAEAAGFESLWAGEHVVLPDPQAPPSPMGPRDRSLDPVVALTWAAAHTARLRLGTGIIILPQRNPVVLAKQLASLDVLCGGRLEVGIGAGYLRPEFDAIGSRFSDRGERTTEYLGAMRSLWEDTKPSFHGSHVHFDAVDAHPRPLQRPLPVVIGGHTPAAFRRAVGHGQGWYGFALTPDATANCLAGLRQAAAAVERPPAWGELEITVTPRGRLTAAAIAEYAGLGVHRLVVTPRPGADRTGVQATIDEAGALA